MSAQDVQMSAQGELELVYFPLHARVGALYALEHSGLAYKYTQIAFENWGEHKPNMAWQTLPVLKGLPSELSAALGEKEMELGQEAAILSYIAAKAPQMKGANLAEEMISNQLVAASEDVFAGLVKIAFKRISNEEAIEYLSKNGALQGLLAMYEKFIQQAGLAKEGKFTSSGNTIGECKMFSVLNAVDMMDEKFLSEYQGLSAFLNRFKNLPATKRAVADRGLVQFFAKPEGM